MINRHKTLSPSELFHQKTMMTSEPSQGHCKFTRIELAVLQESGVRIILDFRTESQDPELWTNLEK
jgi:hypothetical protein